MKINSYLNIESPKKREYNPNNMENRLNSPTNNKKFKKGDLIEISNKAYNLYNENKIIDLNETRVKKERVRYIKIVKEIINSEENKLSHIQKVEDIKEKIKNNRLDFDDGDILKEIADIII